MVVKSHLPQVFVRVESFDVAISDAEDVETLGLPTNKTALSRIDMVLADFAAKGEEVPTIVEAARSNGASFLVLGISSILVDDRVGPEVVDVREVCVSTEAEDAIVGYRFD